MQALAQKVENGYLIPLLDELKASKKNKIWLDIKIVQPDTDDIDQFFDRFQVNLSGWKWNREDAHAR